MIEVFNKQYVGITMTVTKEIGVDVTLAMRTPLIKGSQYWYRDEEHWEVQTVMQGSPGAVSADFNSGGVPVPSGWEYGTVFGIALDLKINDVVFNDVQVFSDYFKIPEVSLDWLRIDDIEAVSFLEGI